MMNLLVASGGFVRYRVPLKAFRGLRYHNAMIMEHPRRAANTILLAVICGMATVSSMGFAGSRPIYDEHADARQQIAEAISQASKTERNIILIFGANW